MKLHWILAVTLLSLLGHRCSSVLLAPITRSYGPLYDGVRLLINDEKFRAEILRNETANSLSEASNALHNSIHHLSKFNETIDNFLHKFDALGEMTEKYALCYKEYERQIAHINRDILQKYFACKRTLENAAAYLKDKARAELEIIRQAVNEIDTVSRVCSIRLLKRSNAEQQVNQPGVALCVVARIGDISQRLTVASHFFLDILADISLQKVYAVMHRPSDADSEDDDEDSCDTFNELRMQVEELQAQFLACVKGSCEDILVFVWHFWRDKRAYENVPAYRLAGVNLANILDKQRNHLENEKKLNRLREFVSDRLS